MTGMGAIVGILGCLAYPPLFSRLGGNVTGIIGFSLIVTLLLFCVGSIFGIGSPFELSAILHPFSSPHPDTPHHVKSLERLWTENQNIFFFVTGVILARLGNSNAFC